MRKGGKKREIEKEEGAEERRFIIKNLGGKKMKKIKKDTTQTLLKFVIPIAILVALAALSTPAMANWDYDGYPLNTSSNGTVYGDVYISVGDRDEQSFSPYITNFSVPSGTTHWAGLYVDAWGGTEDNTGWINVTFNGNPLNPVFINGKNDTNPNAWGSGHGVWWIRYDVTNDVTPGASNQAIVTSTLYGTRIIRAVLVDAYNNTDGCGHVTYYWVNNGNANLHYNGSTGYPYDVDYTTAWFNGTVESPCKADLKTVHHAGSNTEPDYLYFNAFQDYHRPNQVGDDGNETWGDDDIADNYYGFDLHSFDVTNLMKNTGNNATFWRGHDDNGDGWIYHNSSWNVSAGAEGEAYVHPMLAVLTVNSTKHYLTKSMVGGAPNIFSIPLMDTESISTALSSIEPYYPYVNRYNSTTQVWETYNKNKPSPPFSDFTTLDPGIGYQVSPDSNCTLTWTSKDS